MLQSGHWKGLVCSSVGTDWGRRWVRRRGDICNPWGIREESNDVVASEVEQRRYKEAPTWSLLLAQHDGADRQKGEGVSPARAP